MNTATAGKPRYAIAALAVLLLAAGLFLAYVRGRTPPAPEVLIRQSLKDVEAAARAHNPRGVIEVVSDSFRAGPLTRKTLNLQLVRAMQNGRGTNYDVHVNEPRILPSPTGDPDQRLVITQAAVFFTGSGEDIWSANPMTLVMRKESRRKWLFFHEPRWRIVGIANLPPLPGVGDDDGAGIADVFGR
jgi:hypothetical protein